MNAGSPLGRPLSDALGRELGGAPSGGGPSCIPPAVQDTITVLPWCFGFVAGTGTIDGNAAVGRAFGSAIAGAPFGSPIGSEPSDVLIFEFGNAGGGKYVRFQPSTPYSPAVALLTIELIDECSNVIETVFTELFEGVYQVIGGKQFIISDGGSYYVRAYETE